MKTDREEEKETETFNTLACLKNIFMGKARTFLLVDLRDFFSDSLVQGRGTEKKKKKSSENYQLTFFFFFFFFLYLHSKQ